jgi:hypothetical protein
VLQRAAPHGAIPSAKPVAAETKVTDWTANPAGAGCPAGVFGAGRCPCVAVGGCVTVGAGVAAVTAAVAAAVFEAAPLCG